MSHLYLGPRTPRTRLVELVRRYRNEYLASNDTFEREELDGFLSTILTFCVRRGGWKYWDDVNNEACGRPSLDDDAEARMIYLRH